MLNRPVGKGLGRLTGLDPAGPPPGFSDRGRPKKMDKAQLPQSESHTHCTGVVALTVQRSSSEPIFPPVDNSARTPTQGSGNSERRGNSEASAGEEYADVEAVELDSSGHGKLLSNEIISTFSSPLAVGAK
ncbi:hypothetical protein Salat_1178400 [Sesamum alatum]|uniref:Uncharacterized protein n=1 Tax=Sesamum alatum TaxID=300844 RepID=A0AAE1YEI7_9LAMI|nr:hypothetical protein Salat_1178400 [Sesamum alatum]